MTRLFLVTLVFLVSLPAFAEVPLIAKPEFTECMPEQRCLDLENYKLALAMRAQYTWLHDIHVNVTPELISELKKAAQFYAEAEEVQEARAARAEENYHKLFHKYEQLAMSKEENWFAPALPWLVSATVTGVALGIAGTLIIQKYLP